MTILGIAVGIAAVVLLTSIGEGIHRYVLAEFTQFGTNLVGINPGKATTAGVSMGVFGSVRPLTIEDALALKLLPFTKGAVPVVQGNAEVEVQLEMGSRRRRTTVFGVGPNFLAVFNSSIKTGRFLPDDDPNAARAFAVLGSKLRYELFGKNNPLGQRIRIGGHRYRIIGAMESKGQVLGFDLDDTIYIPAGRGLELFNRDGLMEIDVLYHDDVSVDKVVASIKRVLIARHGREDFTITTQQQMLDVLGAILNVLTFAVAAIGGISLLVGGIGIITIMSITVNERVNEIGLLRALGAKRQQILYIFLGEAVILSAVGGVCGLMLGIGFAYLLHFFIANLPVHIPWIYVVLAEISAIIIGLSAGVLPARRAARLDPVVALHTE